MALLNDGVNGVLGRKDRPRSTTKQEAPAKQEAPKGFDPSDYNIDEVKAHIKKHPDQIDAVRKAEKAGDNRVTLVEWLDAQKDDSGLL